MPEHARHPRPAGRLAGAVRRGLCRPSTTPAPASSSRSARSRPCRASSTTCSAATTTSSPCSPTTRKQGDVVAFNQALCGLYAAGLGAGVERHARRGPRRRPNRSAASRCGRRRGSHVADRRPPTIDLGHALRRLPRPRPCSSTRHEQHAAPSRPPAEEPVVITGAALGLPGTARVFDDGNVGRLLHGEQFIDVIPTRIRHGHARQAHHPAGEERRRRRRFETIDSAERRHQARRRAAARSTWPASSASPPTASPALDVDTTPGHRRRPRRAARRRHPAGDALQDHQQGHRSCPSAGCLPDALRDDTGVIFASAFPGLRRLRRRAHGLSHRPRPPRAAGRRSTACAPAWSEADGAGAGARPRSTARIHELGTSIERRALRVRPPLPVPRPVDGPLAVRRADRRPRPEHADQLGLRQHHPGRRAGRGLDPRRPLPAGDHRSPPTTSPATTCSDGSAPASSPAARRPPTTSSSDAALPFDRRRHGMILGMGAAALVVESGEAARERGIQPICEVLGTVTANSAFHGTRLDVDHICQVMERLVAGAEARWGIDRQPDRAADGLRLARDLHAGARRQRRGRGPCAAPGLRRRRRSDRDRQHQGLHRPCDGRRHRRRRRRQGAGNRPGAAGRQLQGSRPGPRPAQPLEGRRLPGRVRAAPRRRLRLADQHDAAALDADARRSRDRSPTSSATPTGSPTPTSGRLGWRASAATPAPTRGGAAYACGARSRSRGRATAHRPPAARALAAPVPPPAPRPRRRAPPPAVWRQTSPARQRRDRRRSSERARRWRSSPRRPATRPTCSTSTSTSRPTSASTPSSKRSCSPPFARPTASRATTNSSCATSRPSPTSSASSVTAPATHPPSRRRVAAVAETAQRRPYAPPPCRRTDAVARTRAGAVAEKTGYPADMLDPELDLEADLGIDTVKQAEMFAAIREAYDIARDDNSSSATSHAHHVIHFVHDRRPICHRTAPWRSTRRRSTAPPSRAPPPTASMRCHRAPVAGARCREDRLSGRHARPRPRPGSRPRHRHRQTGRDVRRHPRGLRHPARRQAQAARLPHAGHVIRFVHDRRPNRPQRHRRATAAHQAVPYGPPLGTMRCAEPHSRAASRCRCCVRRSNLCKATGVTLDAGRRVVVMPDQAASPTRCVDAARATGRRDPAASTTRRAGTLDARLNSWLARRPGARRVLAAGSRSTRGDIGDAGPRRLARRLARAGEAALRHARAVRARRRSRDVPRLGAPGSAGNTATTRPVRTRRLGGAVVGFTKTYKRERAEALVKAVDFDADARRRRGRRLHCSKRRCAIPARSRSVTSRGSAGPSALPSSPAVDGDPASVAHPRHRVRRHRRSRQHRLGHHRRPGCRVRRHVLPARPGRRARPGQSRPRSAS